MPRRHWTINELSQQYNNLATYCRPNVANPAFAATGGDRLLGRYARTGTRWESWLTDYFPPDPDGVALDIGANIGFHSAALSPRFRAVHSFEPCADTARVLRGNISKLENVQVHQVALGDFDGEAFLNVEDRNRGASCMSDSGGEPVRVARLDSFEFEARVSVIKIDVEGFEEAVLRGGAKLLKRDRPVVLFEDCRGGASKLLEGMGFRVRRIALFDYVAHR